MNKTLKIIIAFFLLIIGQSIYSQDCFYYHEYFCKFPNSTYFYSGQSKSGLFTFGMTSEFKIVTFGGEDYHISICPERKFKKVKFRLMEDNESRAVLYDNSEFAYKEEMTFSNNTARRLIIEVSVPDDPTGKGDQELRCIGVLIHSKKANLEPKNKIGF